MSEDADKFTPRYPEYDKAPEFTPTIPAHLTAKLSESERYLVTSISKMEQQNNWLVLQMVVHNKAICETDVRVQKVEAWKKMLTSKWAVLAWLAGGLVLLFGKEAGKSLFEWIKHIP